jgi:hypothetical protein
VLTLPQSAPHFGAPVELDADQNAVKAEGAAATDASKAAK